MPESKFGESRLTRYHDYPKLPGCLGNSGCCSALCALGDESDCLPGQSCVPWYADDEAPDECLSLVGACTDA